jgi:ElaB/YqjD/DUF883 family membrane-anchored ribosome-binding protein
MDEAQRRETDFERTTTDGSFGRDGGGTQGSGSNVSQFTDKAKEQIEPALDKAKEQMQPAMDKAKEQIDSGMDRAREQAEVGLDKAAEGLESAAGRVRDMAGENEGMPAQAGVKLAEGMETAATYLKEHSSEEVMHDIEAYVKQHPTQALVGAVFAGFLFGRMLR